MHDTRVLRQSQLWEVLGDGELLGQNKVTISGCDVGHHLIGDPAYPLQEWLMKPFFGHGKTDPRTAQLELQTKQCPVCCGDVFWEVKRKMEMPLEKK